MSKELLPIRSSVHVTPPSAERSSHVSVLSVGVVFGSSALKS